MKKTLKLIMLAFLLLCFGITQPATAASKNMLHERWTLEEVKKMLVLNQKWVDVPDYSDRAAWDKLFGEHKQEAVTNGEKYLDFEWRIVKATDYIAYQRTGNREIMQDPFCANFVAIGSLFMAEMAEGKGRFMDQLINGVFHVCEMSSWALSAHLVVQPSHRSLPQYDYDYICIFTGDCSNVLSWTYYCLHKEFDKIEPEISRRLYHELDKRILTPYLTRKFWWMSAGSNWNPWTNSNMLLTFMLIENNRDRLAEGVYKTMTSIDHFFNHVHDDGACEEGPHYWSVAHAKAFVYLELLKKITNGGIDLLQEPKIKRMGEYIVNSYIGNDWVVNFADATARGNANPFLVYQFGKSTNSDLMKHFAAAQVAHGIQLKNLGMDFYCHVNALRNEKELKATAPHYHIAPLVWYPQTEICHLRNEKAMVAAKGGYNDEYHNHNDVGSFIFAVNNIPVLIDAGVGTYTGKTFSNKRYTIWNMQSLYHNLPAINGQAQRHGRQYKAMQCKVTDNSFSADIAKAYPAEAKVKQWIRSYELKKREMVIQDKFKLEECVAPNRIHFLTWGDVSMKDGAIHIKVDGAETTMKYDKKQLDATIETIPLDDPTHYGVWGKKIYRLCLIPKKMTKMGTYKIKMIF